MPTDLLGRSEAPPDGTRRACCKERQPADLTQVELATQMGVAQAEISRIEKRHDMLLSTLTSYQIGRAHV